MSALVAFCLLIALILDRKFGDPDSVWSKVPHPVTLFGKWIEFADNKLNVGKLRRWKGTAFVVISCWILGVLGNITEYVYGGFIIDTLAAATLLAHKSLLDHLKEVAAKLRVSISQGRMAVSKIVGRDVSELDSSEVSKAAVESAAEGFSDGVVAPCFWFLVLGLPGILIYKFANTADSMIGYRNEKYEQYGWAAARLDDILNWIPARITAILMLGAQHSYHLIHSVRKDASFHNSPNAGWPEAAMAYALGITLGGTRSYQSEVVDLKSFNEDGRDHLEPSDIDDAVGLLRKSHQYLLLVVAAIGVVLFVIF